MQSFKDWKNKDQNLFQKRKEGAEKIANEARAKGGPSELTYWHFKAKLPEYDTVFQILNSDDPEPKIKKKFDELVSKIHSNLNSQRHFQEVMGRLEVYGEVLVQLRQPENY